MSRRVVALTLGAALLGVAAEAWSFDLEQWDLWVPDLLTGWVLLGAAIWVWRSGRAPGTSVLLAATGVCWYLGFLPGGLYLHRGPLVHLLLTFTGWWPRSRLDAVAVGVGYAAAVVQPVWADDRVTVLLALGLVATAARGAQLARPEDRPDRRTAAWCATGFAAALVAVVIGARATVDGAAVVPLLTCYEATLAVIAIVLARQARGSSVSEIADMVVELAAPPRVRLQDDLRRVLRDPLLMLGYWSPTANGYVGVDSRPMDLTAEERNRVVTPIGGADPPTAVLVHNPDALDDPRVGEAVATAVQLSSRHRALHQELAIRRRELTASRQRLLLVADRERMRLDQQLRDGPEVLLDELSAILDSLPDGDRRSPETNAHVARAREHLTLLREELRDLSAGLMPRELATSGLEPALHALADRLPLPVSVQADTGPLPPDVARAVYFICSEALTNAVKHAAASEVAVRVQQHDGRLVVEVSDDGVGGVRADRGTGVSGLVDRTEALGGSLEWRTAQGGGTTLVAALPLRPAQDAGVPA